MNKAIIETDLLNNKFILKGEIDVLFKRRARSFLKDFLKADIDIQKKLISIKFSDDKEKTLKSIKELLQKFDLEENPSQETKILLKDFYREEMNFKNFSKLAFDIRNNIVDVEEFKYFTESLTKLLPNRRLYDLQLLSSFHLTFAQNACNFSVPGAGKTSIVYGAYSYLHNLQKNNSKYIEKILIIGPLSSFGPWESEYLECFGKKPSSIRLSGAISLTDKIHYLQSNEFYDITLISYQGVPSLKEYLKQFLKRNKVMVILDEAHKIKNVDGGIIAKSVLELANYCRSRIILTGTPAPNGYQDLYNLYKFIWPNKDIMGYFPYQLIDMSKYESRYNVTDLINRISPFFIRIKKSDLGVPKPINNPPIMIKMGNKQRHIYNFIEHDYMNYLISEHRNDSNILGQLTKARLIRLMQAATNPSLLTKTLDEYFSNNQDEIYIDDTDIIKNIMNYESNEIPSKFIETGELVKKILDNNQKVIIWTTFVKNIFDLQSYLKSLEIESKTLFGQTPIENGANEDNDEIFTREKIIRDFHKKDSNFKVVIANPFAVSESISLHKACHNAIYLERTFNAAHFVQSKDRIHRYGLEKKDKINYYYLLSEDSIDETIHERLQYKEERMNYIMESQPIPLFNNLDEDYVDNDIRLLIRNYVKRIK